MSAVKKPDLLFVVFPASNEGFYEPPILSIRLAIRTNVLVGHNDNIQVGGGRRLPTSDAAKQHGGQAVWEMCRNKRSRRILAFHFHSKTYEAGAATTRGSGAVHSNGQQQIN